MLRQRLQTVVPLGQWFLTFFTYLSSFYQTRLSDLRPIHSMALFFQKYEIINTYSLE